MVRAMNRLIDALLLSIGAVFAAALVIYLVLAGWTWVFTDDSPGRYVARAVVCLVLTLGFRFLATHQYQPTRTRPATRRRARKA